jgi:mono/diheme cytochrome c family protein
MMTAMRRRWMIVCLFAGLGVSAPALFWARPAWAESGEMMFNEYCVGCHQVGGTGVPGEYPRLAGRVNKIASDPRGRAFLTELMLTGMSGTITVDGRKILGIMPNFDDLKDDELAAVLNYVVHLERGKGAAFTPQLLKQARTGPKATPEEMAESRNKLAGARIIP